MPMQAKEIFEAQSRSLRELLSDNGLGLYLPPYQRPYGWGKDKVGKLLDDTLHGLKNLSESPDSFTFLGTIITIHDHSHVTVNPIVKDEVPSKVLTVIDGQQRISSLILMLVSLHNLIRQGLWSVFKGKSPDSSNHAQVRLHGETSSTLRTLATAFYERHNDGDTPIYPRLIRAFDDQWAKYSNLKKYESPIARLVYEYSVLADGESMSARPTDFKPKARPGASDGEDDLIRRFAEIRSALTRLSQGTSIEEFEGLPPLTMLALKPDFQRALFNHELNPDLCDFISGLDEGREAELMRLVMLAAYTLNRIALTVVQGKDEDYAFTIFESLNTTGEPLTAFETFVPRVIMSEQLREYKDSEAYQHIAAVKSYLNRFDAGDKLQNATRDLLVTFALAETGKKLSKRLADQRAYMKETFDRHKDDEVSRVAYLCHLRDTATFVGSAWEPDSSHRQLIGLPVGAMTDTINLCLAFLKDLNHTIALAPLVRFYSSAVGAAEGGERSKMIAEFEAAVKAVTAFTVFWRASRRGTGNIDSQYRAVMAGDTITGIAPLARNPFPTDRDAPLSVVDVDALKAELVARLTDDKHGGISNLKLFLGRSSELPLYAISRHLTRFLLLAAYHDTAEDPDRPGLIRLGKVGVSPCFTHDGWQDDAHFTIEHIAPQQATSGWDSAFYSEKDVVHRLGNLVLAPRGANSSLSSRPWDEKRVLYGALGASTGDEAKATLADSGLTFVQSTEELAEMSRYLPHLRALGRRAGDYDLAFMEERGQVLLNLAYLRFKDWLGLELLESVGSADDEHANSAVNRAETGILGLTESVSSA